MRLTTLVGSLACGAALAATTSVANAQAPGNRGLPMNYIDRPLTLPAGILEPQFEVNAVHVPGGTPQLPSVGATPNDFQYNMLIGAAVGLSKRLELQSTFLPFQLGPNQQYGNPNIQLTALLSRSRQVDVGARFNVELNTVPLVVFQPQGINGQVQKTTGVKVESTTLNPGLPLVLRFQHRVRVDTGLFADITLGRDVTSMRNGVQQETTGAIWGVNIPVDLSVALAKNAYIGAGSGFKIDDLNQSGNSFSMPLKMYAGFSVGTRRHPFFDIEPYVSWDHLLTPGQSAPSTNGVLPANTVQQQPIPTTPTTGGPQETFHWDAWQMGLQFRGYLHFI